MVYCIQVDESADTEQEITDTQQLMQGATEGSSSLALDLSPLLRRMDRIESTVSQHSTSLDDVFKYLRRLMPDEKLTINKDNEKLLRAKLAGRISQGRPEKNRQIYQGYNRESTFL